MKGLTFQGKMGFGTQTNTAAASSGTAEPRPLANESSLSEKFDPLIAVLKSEMVRCLVDLLKKSNEVRRVLW